MNFVTTGFSHLQNLAISFIKPLNGDAAKYIHNGIKVNLKVPLY